jgi:hypothetical protein
MSFLGMLSALQAPLLGVILVTLVQEKILSYLVLVKKVV